MSPHPGIRAHLIAARVQLDAAIALTSQPAAQANLADETEAYQALLEGVRAHPDNTMLTEDLARARQAMERAWCETIGVGENHA